MKKLTIFILFSLFFIYLKAQKEVYFSTNRNEIYLANLSTCTSTLIGSIPLTGGAADLFDIAINPLDSQLYGIKKGRLILIDRTTATTTDIGYLGTKYKDANSLTFGADGTLYGAVYSFPNNIEIFTINLLSGTVTSLGKVDFSYLIGNSIQPIEPAGDLTFYKGELYLTISDKVTTSVPIPESYLAKINLDNIPNSTNLGKFNNIINVFGVNTVGCPETMYAFQENNVYELSSTNLLQPIMTCPSISNHDVWGATSLVESLPKINLGSDTVLTGCAGNSLLLDATTSQATNYLWSNNSTSPTLTVTESGAYWVEVQLRTCSVFDTIEVGFTEITSSINLSTICIDSCAQLNTSVNIPTTCCEYSLVIDKSPVQAVTDIEVFVDGISTGKDTDGTPFSPSTDRIVTHYFKVCDNSSIDVVVTSPDPKYSKKHQYSIYDNQGNIIFQDGMNGTLPIGGHVGTGSCSNFDYTYAWSPATSLDSTNISTPMACGLSSLTSYIVTIEDINQPGCYMKDTVTVSYPCTVTGVVASFTPSNSVICERDSITFTDNSTGNSISNWAWTFNGGSPTSANTQGPHTIGFNTPGNYNIILQVTDSSGTDDTTIAITVLAHTFSSTNTSICQGDSILLGGTFQTTAGSYLDTLINTDGCDSIITTTLTINPSENASYNYPASNYCQSETDPIPTITGTNGGTFTSSPAGLNINSGTGTIDLSASTPGTYGVLYTTLGTSCPDTLTAFVTISSTEDATFNYSATNYCQSETNPTPTITGTNGGTFTSSPTGLSINSGTGTIDLSASTPGTYGVLYTTPSASCQDTLTVFVTIDSVDSAIFNYTSTTYCINDINPIPTITGTTGGSFTINNGGTVHPSTGELNLTTSGTGSYTITYTTSGICPASTPISITITNQADATITPIGPYCEIDATVSLTAVDTGGIWSGLGVIGTTFSPSNAGAGTHQVIYSIGTGNCADIDTIDVVVNSNPVIALTPNDANCFNDDGSINSTITGGTPSFNYNWDNGQSTAAISNLPAGIYTLFVTDANGCTATSFATVNEVMNNCEYNLYLPNIFSPNGDGNNDVFFVRGKGIKTLNFIIYSRWGEKIFETTDIKIGWDGTFRGEEMNPAVFVYYVKATMFNDEIIEEKGNVTLVR